MAVTLAIVATFAVATGARAQNPFKIDGVVTTSDNSGVASGNTAPNAQATYAPDPASGVKELGPINSSNTKIGVINRYDPPTLGFTNPNAQVDLNGIWTQTATALNGDIWFYFAWSRDSNSGSGFLAIEVGQDKVPTGCVYTGVDQTSKTSSASLIASCNPWRNRKAGDFLLLWDQSGSDRHVYKRSFVGTAPNLTLDTTIQTLGSAVAEFSTDGFSGEAAIDLTTDIFPANGACVSYANLIPSTVTGNSDTADYKDTVLAAFAPISNCGLLEVTKTVLDGSGNTTTLGGTFPYQVDRNGLAIHYASDGFSGSALTTITGTFAHNGDVADYTKLIPSSGYEVSEDTSGFTTWKLKDITCVYADGTSTSTKGVGTTLAFSISVGKLTTCTITNQYVPPAPNQSTSQWVKLFDRIDLTNITPLPSTQRASWVTFTAYDGSANCVAGSPALATITATLNYDDTVTGAGKTAWADTQTGTNGAAPPVVYIGKTIYWKVYFPGDAQNGSFTTTCGAETTQIIISQ